MAAQQGTGHLKSREFPWTLARMPGRHGCSRPCVGWTSPVPVPVPASAPPHHPGAQGLVSLQSKNAPHSQGEYDVYSTFQSHEPEFDYLKSLEIEEKINKIKWLPQQNAAHSLLSTNGEAGVCTCVQARVLLCTRTVAVCHQMPCLTSLTL